MNSLLYGGIDAGGTSTKCLLLSAGGEILARAETGTGNCRIVGYSRALREVEKALAAVCRQAGVKEIDLLGIGMAGIGRGGERESVIKALQRLDSVKEFYLTDDGEIALWGAHAGQPGIVIVAGTGSVVYGMDSGGRVVKAGGWGPLLGDEGSGYWIGMQAVKAVIKEEEGRGPETLLREPVLNELGVRELADLIPLVHQGDLAREKISALALEVIKALEKGDSPATGIINQALDELVLTVKAVADRIKMSKVAAAGGLFRSSLFYEFFKVKLKGIDHFTVEEPLFEPVMGAVFYALKRAGRELPPII